MKEKKIWKIAVVGCGSFANDQYFPNITKEANAICVAACDIVPERAQAACEKYGIPNWYSSVYELIEKCDFDIAIDATSIQAHHEVNMAILGAGKHLVSQKPAAPTVEMLTEQIELAKAKKVKYVCVPIHPMRFDLAVAKQMMADGAIGNISYIKCNLAHGGPNYFQYRDADPSWFFEDGAGALVDMGVHGIQIVTHMFGPAKKISCLAAVTTPERTVRSGAYDGKKIKSDKIPDEYFINITFANGKIGLIDTGFSQKASKQPQLEIYGSEGTISLSSGYMQNPMPSVYMDAPERGIRGWVEPMTWKNIPEKLISQCCCIRDVIRAIEGDCDPVLTPEHARHVLEIMCKIPEAVKSGCTVELETTF